MRSKRGDVQGPLPDTVAQTDCNGGGHYRLLIVGVVSPGLRVDRRSAGVMKNEFRIT